MGSQIIFFEKNKADYSNTSVVATASQGNEYAPYVLNRSNESAWMTTGSVDADNTTLEIDFNDLRTISDLILIKHNFKSFTIQYWDGDAWQNFSTPISENACNKSTSYYQFTPVGVLKIRITIYGTQVANSDKYLFQVITTVRLGQLEGWPVIKGARHNKNRKTSSMLSGKSMVVDNVGGFECQLAVKEWRLANDIALIELLQESSSGFLVWLCGGEENQFFSRVQGYRAEDVFLMKCKSDYSPEFAAGMYRRGLVLKIDLVEVTD